MEIQFKNNTLKKQYQSHAEAFSAYGKQVGKKYIERVNIIKRSRNIDELMAVRALKCHSLKGNRKGEWAVKLTGFARLIFTLKGENLEIARIEEVSKHYDD